MKKLIGSAILAVAAIASAREYGEEVAPLSPYEQPAPARSESAGAESQELAPLSPYLTRAGERVGSEEGATSTTGGSSSEATGAGADEPGRAANPDADRDDAERAR